MFFLINNQSFANRISLNYTQRMSETINKKQFLLPHFLTFTSNMTTIVIFLPDSMIKENTSILPLSRIWSLCFTTHTL